MNVLHICNDFADSKVHANLYRELDSLGVNQTIFTFYRGSERDGRNMFKGASTEFVYKNILKPYHRFFYHNKIDTAYKSLLYSIEPNHYQLSHAISVFTNGPIAYRLWRDYGIPYIVAVRNTDINEFMTYAPYAWMTGLKVIKNASKIVFISKALMETFCHHFLIRRMMPELKSKMVLQPNGIDAYWLSHIKTEQAINNHQLIYVGRFDTNKNVQRLVKAVLSLRDRYPDICLHLVGGGSTWHNSILKIASKYPDHIIYHGRISDKSELQKQYAQCTMFAMPSIHETFGLVYIEALTQHLAVIYTRGQGIDGLFDSSVGEGVNAFSKQSIGEAITRIFDNRNTYKACEVVDFKLFEWSRIARNYNNLYRLLLNEN